MFHLGRVRSTPEGLKGLTNQETRDVRSCVEALMQSSPRIETGTQTPQLERLRHTPYRDLTTDDLECLGEASTGAAGCGKGHLPCFSRTCAGGTQCDACGYGEELRSLLENKCFPSAMREAGHDHLVHVNRTGFTEGMFTALVTFVDKCRTAIAAGENKRHHAAERRQQAAQKRKAEAGENAGAAGGRAKRGRGGKAARDDHAGSDDDVTDEECDPPSHSAYGRWRLHQDDTLRMDSVAAQDVEADKSNALYQAVCANDADQLQALVDDGADPLKPFDGSGATALTTAAQLGCTNVLDKLAGLEIDLDEPDGRGWTAAATASSFGQPQVLRWLGQNGANLCKPNGPGSALPGWSAPTLASSEAVLQALLEAGVDLASHVDEAVDGDEPVDPAIEPSGWSVATAAAGWERRDASAMLAFLQGKGVALDLQDNRGWTPATAAAAIGDQGVLEQLGGLGVDMSTADGNGRTPVMAAFETGRYATVELLISKLGAKSTRQVTDMWTRKVIHKAIQLPLFRRIQPS